MSLPDDAFVALSGETRDFDVNVMRKLIPGTGARSGERGGKRASNARRKKERERERERESIAFSALPFLTSRRASSRRQLDSPG